MAQKPLGRRIWLDVLYSQDMALPHDEPHFATIAKLDNPNQVRLLIITIAWRDSRLQASNPLGGEPHGAPTGG